MKLVENDLLGSIIIGLIFLVIILLAELWARKGHPSEEAMRKFVHINGGVASLLFPFLISNSLYVLALAIGFAGLFFIGSKMNFLHCLNSVDRDSHGSEYYPFAIWLLFQISIGNLWLYISSVLVLSIADAGAALIGSKYGSIRFKIGESEKSLQGSVIFFLVAFCALSLPMLFLSDLPRESCILVALLVGFLLTCVEAVSVRGTDNIFVPAIACYVLLKITSKPLDEIRFQCISLFVIFIVFGIIIWRTKLLNVGAGLIFLSIFYASWSLGSLHWALPVAFAFLLFTIIRYPLTKKFALPKVKAKTLFAALVIPFGVLVLANLYESYKIFFGLYLTAFVNVASFSVWRTVLRVKPMAEISSRIMGSLFFGFLCWLFICVPIWFFQDIPFYAPLGILLITLIFAVVHELVSEKKNVSQDPIWSDYRFIIIILTVASYWGLQHLELIDVWSPK